jgi:hypothetical protein
MRKLAVNTFMSLTNQQATSTAGRSNSTSRPRRKSSGANGSLLASPVAKSTRSRRLARPQSLPQVAQAGRIQW